MFINCARVYMLNHLFHNCPRFASKINEELTVLKQKMVSLDEPSKSTKAMAEEATAALRDLIEAGDRDAQNTATQVNELRANAETLTKDNAQLVSEKTALVESNARLCQDVETAMKELKSAEESLATESANQAEAKAKAKSEADSRACELSAAETQYADLQARVAQNKVLLEEAEAKNDSRRGRGRF